MSSMLLTQGRRFVFGYLDFLHALECRDEDHERSGDR